MKNNSKEIVREKKELVKIGQDLQQLTEEDVAYIMDEKTTLAKAYTRMTTCRQKAK